MKITKINFKLIGNLNKLMHYFIYFFIIIYFIIIKKEHIDLYFINIVSY